MTHASARRPALIAMVTALGAAGAVGLARRGQLTWGAGPGERAGALPGDDLVPRADLVATRAIEVAAPPEAVMPWLRQLGQDRGGFYSYDVLENLVGLDIRSAERIRPEWQSEVGDDVLLAPEAPLRIVRLSGTALVLQRRAVEPGERGPSSMPFDFTWAFVLVPHRRGCRLVVRERYAYRVRWAPLVVEPVSWISWLMTQRMLRGIRDRAVAGGAPAA